MKPSQIHNLSGLVIATFCLMVMPDHAYSVEQSHNARKSKSSRIPKAGSVFHDCAGCPDMVVILEGSFAMGSPASEKSRNDNEGPVDGSAWQGDISKRVVRDGSWNNSPSRVRSAKRGMQKIDERFCYVGFRIARMLP